ILTNSATSPRISLQKPAARRGRHFIGELADLLKGRFDGGSLFADRRNMPDKSRADDHAVCKALQALDLIGAADSEADGQRQLRLAPEPLKLLTELGGQGLADAGGAGDRNAIQKTGGRREDPLC